MSDMATRLPCPIILIRGFGGLSVEDERQIAYQGFNDGTVYPHKRGENYIYEGFVLRLMKSDWRYRDATNVVGFLSRPIEVEPELPKELDGLDPTFFSKSDVVIDPGMARLLLESDDDPSQSFWVFRYYDLGQRSMELFARALVRLIDFIAALIKHKTGSNARAKVNIVAHSMGGLVVREAVQHIYPERGVAAAQCINKIVTLGTPHKGIAFQIFERWAMLAASSELEAFFPDGQDREDKEASWKNFGKHFPLERLLCVVGTDYRSYSVRSSSLLNRVFSVDGEFGPNYNRSDGLVKQAAAQINGAPRTFIHKCHGGFDSLVTSREAFEIATRFFFGDVRVRVRLQEAEVLRGSDFFGKSEFFFGMTVKARGIDFELFHQSAEAENCYGPFSKPDLTGNPAFGWAGPDRLIWEGWLNSSASRKNDLVLRADFYVGERDLFGIGFSDNVIFRKQYYFRAITTPTLQLQVHTGEGFERGLATKPVKVARNDHGWTFPIEGTGFRATLQVELDLVPEHGAPVPLTAGTKDLGLARKAALRPL